MSPEEREEDNYYDDPEIHYDHEDYHQDSPLYDSEEEGDYRRNSYYEHQTPDSRQYYHHDSEENYQRLPEENREHYESYCQRQGYEPQESDIHESPPSRNRTYEGENNWQQDQINRRGFEAVRNYPGKDEQGYIQYYSPRSFTCSNCGRKGHLLATCSKRRSNANANSEYQEEKSATYQRFNILESSTRRNDPNKPDCYGTETNEFKSLYSRKNNSLPSVPEHNTPNQVCSIITSEKTQEEDFLWH